MLFAEQGSAQLWENQITRSKSPSLAASQELLWRIQRERGTGIIKVRKLRRPSKQRQAGDTPQRVTLAAKCLSRAKVNNWIGVRGQGQYAGRLPHLDMEPCLFPGSMRGFRGWCQACNSLRFAEASRTNTSPVQMKESCSFIRLS